MNDSGGAGETRHVGVLAEPAAPRYGQLTYTSFEGRGAGGWQVKEQRGLSPAEEDLLRSRIDPQLNSGVELPRFPSPEDVARFPRRLVFAAQPDTADPVDLTVAWWHYASAGLDGSGRPGNVFVHVLLDRTPGTTLTGGNAGPGRPIDLWRSPDWLTPFGSESVQAARLGSRPPGPGQEVTGGRLVAFLLDWQHYRLGVLSVLLDACAAAVHGGPPVVLATDSTDHAAWWVAAVTHLMSPAAAQRFGFSTLERVTSLPSRLVQGLRLCCVPRSDYETLEAAERGFVLIDENETVSLGDLDGEPHVTVAGDRIAVTEWSALAKVALMDEQTAAWALSQLDQVARQVDDSTDAGARSELAWPLAVVVATAPEHLSDAVAEASRVLARRTPEALRTNAELFESARSLIEGSLGDTTGDVWKPLERAVAHGEPPSVMGDMLLSIYVSRAVADDRWLTQNGGPPVPGVSWSTGSHPTEVSDALSSAVGRLLAAEPEDELAATALLALTDFATRLGLLTPELLDLVSVGLERSFVHLLFGPDAVRLVTTLAPPVHETLSGVIRPLVNNVIGLEQRPLGARLAPEVLGWLYAGGTSTLLPQPHQPYDAFRLRAELAVQWLRAESVSHPDERPLAVVALLEEGGDPADVEHLFATPPWSVRELAAVESRFPGLMPLTFFAAGVKAAEPGQPLNDLGTSLLRSRRTGEAFEPYGPGDLIRMRLAVDEGWWRKQERFGPQLALVLAGAVHGLGYADVELHPDALDHVQAAMVLAVAGAGGASAAVPGRSSTGPSLDDVQQLVQAAKRPSGFANRTVWEIVSAAAREHLTVDKLVVTALLGDPAFPVPEASTSLHRWAHRIRVDVDGGRGPVLRQCVVHEVTDGGATYDELIEKVKDQLWSKVGRSENPERAWRTCGRFAQGWLKPMFPAEGLLGRLR